MPSKLCHGCLTTKDFSEFWKHKGEKDGLQTRCKVCMTITSLKWQKEHRARARNFNRKSVYSSLTSRLSDRFHTLTQNSKRRKFIAPNFTRSEFRNWAINQPQICFYCKTPLSFMDKSATIDRLDSKLPYMLNNICISCERCNKVKGCYLTVAQMEAVVQVLGWRNNDEQLPVDNRPHLR